MKVVFFGTPYFVIPVLEVLLKKYEVVAVVTTPDQKAGRKQLLTPTPVKAAYQKYLDDTSNNTQHPPHIFTPDKLSLITAQLSALKPDLFVVAAYGKIIPQTLLDIPAFGAVNIHPSLLPKYRGPSPIQQTLLNGDKVTGVTLIKMDREMDHGPILSAESFEVHPTDTFETLAKHLFEKAAAMLPSAIDAYLAGNMHPIEQNHKEATFTSAITKEHGYIDLDNPPKPEELINKIRAYYPWPTVWTKIKIKNQEVRMKLLPPYVCNTKDPFCVQLEGKNPMTLKDFLNGYPEMKEIFENLLV